MAAMKKNKICHLTSVHPRFDVRIFHKECKSLAISGFEVVLIAPGETNETLDGVSIVSFPKIKSRVCRFLFSWIVMYKKALGQKARLYHFHDPELIPCGLLLRFSGKKVVFDIHENIALSFRQKEWLPLFVRMFVSKVYRVFEKLVLPAFHLLVLAESSYLTYYPKKSILALNYPLTGLTGTGDEKKLSPIRFAYVGVIHETRGLMQMLRIIEILNARGIDSELHLAGYVRPENILDIALSKFENQKLKNKVQYHGVLSLPQSYQLVSQCHIGFALWDNLPNFYECIPTKVYEYMNAGLPFVVSDFPVFRELIELDKAGIGVSYSKPEEAALKIEELLRIPEKIKLLGKNGREAVLQKYNWTKESEKLVLAYNNILS